MQTTIALPFNIALRFWKWSSSVFARSSMRSFVPAASAKLVTLHEHTARTAARVEHLTFGGFEHGRERLHDARGREVFTTALAFGIGELADEVIIDAPEHVHSAGFRTKDFLGKKIDEASDAFLVEIRAGVDGREQTLEFWKCPFEQGEDVVQLDFDIIGPGDLDDVVPPGLFRDEEDVFLFEIVGVLSDFKGELFVGGVEVAFRVGDLGVNFAEALFV